MFLNCHQLKISEDKTWRYLYGLRNLAMFTSGGNSEEMLPDRSSKGCKTGGASKWDAAAMAPSGVDLDDFSKLSFGVFDALKCIIYHVLPARLPPDSSPGAVASGGVLALSFGAQSWRMSGTRRILNRRFALDLFR